MAQWLMDTIRTRRKGKTPFSKIKHEDYNFEFANLKVPSDLKILLHCNVVQKSALLQNEGVKF